MYLFSLHISCFFFLPLNWCSEIGKRPRVVNLLKTCITNVDFFEFQKLILYGCYLVKSIHVKFIKRAFLGHSQAMFVSYSFSFLEILRSSSVIPKYLLLPTQLLNTANTICCSQSVLFSSLFPRYSFLLSFSWTKVFNFLASC